MAQTRHWSVPGNGLRVWTPDQDNAATAMGVEVLDHGLTPRQHIQRPSYGAALDIPLAAPHPLLLDLGQNQDMQGSPWWGVAVFNPGDQPCLLKLVDEAGLLIKSWSIASKQKLLLSREDFPRDKMSARLETEHPVTALILYVARGSILFEANHKRLSHP
jgi:hypothetical protein